MFLVLALTFSGLVGCGEGEEDLLDDPDENGAALDPDDADDEDEADDPGDDIVITVAAGAVGQEFELTEKAAEMYSERNEGVRVEVLDTPDLADDRLGLYLQFFEAQSSEVDVYQIDVIWPGDLAEHFVDLYDYGAEDVVGDHFPAIVENNEVDGELVGIPWFTDAGLLYFRTDLLEKYDLDPPETWEELENAADVIQEGERADGNSDFVGFVWQGNAYEGLTCNALEWIASNEGGQIIEPDGEITVNNENAVEIIDMAAGWVGTISPDGVTGMAEEDARAIWQGGNAAFMRNWPYAYSLSEDDDSAVQGVFDVSALPAGSGSPAATLGGWQLGVSRYSENVEAAADVALFLASEEVQKMRAIEGAFNPTIMSLYEDDEVLEAVPFFGSLYDVFTNAVARPSTISAPQYNEVSTAFFRAVHSVLTGDMDAADALEELELDLEDITGF
ncbi:ABC transporter substrate-binding protein [Isachenkonia alkalipeptolytica]|uniref:ABC transporter substrate-binding protein n=2 Tax=Isachenkonia alkalipeptolytica TaxID=2565777 RepID=A0AA43XKW7_9CLOT|nr:ABC transporter substrate-binding protein [Isachenkonia alkalipeptolytica]